MCAYLAPLRFDTVQVIQVLYEVVTYTHSLTYLLTYLLYVLACSIAHSLICSFNPSGALCSGRGRVCDALASIHVGLLPHQHQAGTLT